MVQRQPVHPIPHRPAGLGLLAFLTFLSLLLNVVLIGAAAYLYLQISPLRGAAADLGRALRQATSEPLALAFPIRQDLPLDLAYPIRETFTVTVNTTVPVDTSIHLEVDLPVAGRVSQDVPVYLDVPVNVSIPVAISTTLPISLVIPVSLTVPLTLDLRSLPLGGELARLGEVLEGLDPQGGGQ